MKKLYLLCGVSGSGKSYVCNRMAHKFTYVSHDLYKDTLIDAVVNASKRTEKALLVDCPFGETKLREDLTAQGFDVIPLFIIESPEIVSKRYFAREKKPITKSALTRASTIVNRADEWKALKGTSDQMLNILLSL